MGRLNAWAQWTFARGPTSSFIPVNNCRNSPRALSCPGAHSAIKTTLIVCMLAYLHMVDMHAIKIFVLILFFVVNSSRSSQCSTTGVTKVCVCVCVLTNIALNLNTLNIIILK